jgi:hypothetical protein
LWLWAWERPEDLSFLRGHERRVGVAYLARTLRVDGDRVFSDTRQQPLVVPEHVWLSTVVRIEVPRGRAPSPSTLPQVVDQVLAAWSESKAPRVQIDFDARRSETAYYTQLLTALRAQLPQGVALDITALAAWCAQEHSWLDAAKLPVDRVVPMVFSMGPDTRLVRAWLSVRGEFKSPQCRDALGISTDEPFAPSPSVQTVYAFSPRPWTAASAHALPRWKDFP